MVATRPAMQQKEGRFHPHAGAIRNETSTSKKSRKLLTSTNTCRHAPIQPL